MRVLITGYTYTRQNLFDVFESYPEKDKLSFILPNNWTAKNGTVKFEPFTKPGFAIYHSSAFFSHSNYPIIGGLLKGWMPFFVFRLLCLKFTTGVDVMFSTGEPNLLSTTYNALWAKLLGIKFIFNYWENIPYEQKDHGFKLIIKKAIIRMNVALSDGAICGMHKAEDILRTFAPEMPIGTFLHAGFNPERFSAAVPPKMSRPGETVFLYVGALGYRKGIHLVLEALSQLRKKHPVHFILVGSGEYKHVLDEKISDLRLDDVVTRIPWLPNEELPSIFTSANVFVYPSIPYQGWEEQFGYSIAEASLCELPVISTNTGSIYEVLLDGKTGLMVEPNNLIDLQATMERLITDSGLRTTLGKAGRIYIEENFSNRIIAGKLHTFFKKVLVS
jgi:glycosyltransferase involved in cell wall biosynthesis